MQLSKGAMPFRGLCDVHEKPVGGRSPTEWKALYTNVVSVSPARQSEERSNGGKLHSVVGGL
jgi:hypothetical protein